MKKNEQNKLIKFLPSYVGSKAYWVPHLLKEFKDSDFVEFFCGSAVLSANLAKSAILNDLDGVIYKILSNYDDLIVPDKFSKEDYFIYRKNQDWWKYVFCLQKMSFSGVFRYSKNGFNVPIKKDFKKDFIEIRPEFELAKKRYKELNPEILNLNYDLIPEEKLVNKVLIFDPPYQGSKASYNTAFDYEKYWAFVKKVTPLAKAVIIFDTKSNLLKAGYPVDATRKMRVNGKHKGDIEAVTIIRNNTK